MEPPGSFRVVAAGRMINVGRYHATITRDATETVMDTRASKAPSRDVVATATWASKEPSRHVTAMEKEAADAMVTETATEMRSREEPSRHVTAMEEEAADVMVTATQAREEPLATKAREELSHDVTAMKEEECFPMAMATQSRKEKECERWRKDENGHPTITHFDQDEDEGENEEEHDNNDPEDGLKWKQVHVKLDPFTYLGPNFTCRYTNGWMKGARKRIIDSKVASCMHSNNVTLKPLLTVSREYLVRRCLWQNTIRLSGMTRWKDLAPGMKRKKNNMLNIRGKWKSGWQ